MGLLKTIELNNGITLKYHRIVSVNNVTNQESIIEVASYTSKDKREEEKRYIGTGENMDIFLATELIPLEYTETLNVISAYEKLKKLPKFENAIDD